MLKKKETNKKTRKNKIKKVFLKKMPNIPLHLFSIPQVLRTNPFPIHQTYDPLPIFECYNL